MLPFFLKARLVFVTVKKAARYPVASTRFNCACEVGGGGEGLRWLETPMQTSEWKIFPLVVKVKPRSQS